MKEQLNKGDTHTQEGYGRSIDRKFESCNLRMCV